MHFMHFTDFSCNPPFTKSLSGRGERGFKDEKILAGFSQLPSTAMHLGALHFSQKVESVSRGGECFERQERCLGCTSRDAHGRVWCLTYDVCQILI